MRRIGLALAALLMAVTCQAVDSVAWGTAVNGIRLGISFGPPASAPEIRMFLENSGSAPQQIPIGNTVGKATAFDVRFDGTALDGTEHHCFEINSFTPIAGLVLPVVITVMSGATREFRFPLGKIACTEGPGNITFADLVKERASLQLSLDALISGKLSPPN